MGVLSSCPFTVGTTSTAWKPMGWDQLHLWLIHVDVWQKSSQCCKAIINQLKINKYSFLKKKNVLQAFASHICNFREGKNVVLDKIKVSVAELSKWSWRVSLVVQWLRNSLQSRRRQFNPQSGKIPRGAGPLSPCTTTRESLCATSKAQHSQK